MKALKGRLQKLESTIVTRPMGEPRPLSEADIRVGNALQELYWKSPPVVEAEVSAWTASHRSYQPREASNFVYAAFKCVKEHLENGTPLAMPPEVVEVYCNFPEARPLHECEDCGYAVPFEPPRPQSDPPAPARVFFERCPICGGKVGWWSFRLKRQRELQATS